MRKEIFMLNLEKTALIGKGLHRECYRHPENKKLCVKVIVAGNTTETRREKKYYRHLEKKGISWDIIPRYYNDIETNLGVGSVFDLIADDNDEVSKTLEYYLSTDEKTEKHYDALSKGLNLLKSHLLHQQIITMTLKPKNISCKKLKSGGFRLFIVDNIGCSDFIPICNYSNFFAAKKILRRWKSFEDCLLNTYKHNNSLQRMFTYSHR